MTSSDASTARSVSSGPDDKGPDQCHGRLARDPGMTTQPDDQQSAVTAHDPVAAAVDELGRLAQLLTAGFGDRSSDTSRGR